VRAADLTTNILDLTSFFLATPELIGMQRIDKFSAIMTKLTNWTPGARWGWYSRVSARQVAFLQTRKGMLILGAISLTGLLLMGWAAFVNPPESWTELTLSGVRGWVVGVSVAWVFAWFFRLWIFLARSHDLRQVLLVLGGLLFVISRVIAILDAGGAL
jgi:hypothetical protein